jgi:hypothetical protein
MDRAMAIPAQKVFWEATPVAEVAARVPRGQASSLLRRAYATSIPPYTLNTASLTERRGTIGISRYERALSSKFCLGF